MIDMVPYRDGKDPMDIMEETIAFVRNCTEVFNELPTPQAGISRDRLMTLIYHLNWTVVAGACDDLMGAPTPFRHSGCYVDCG
jgi:hypothetical protein